MIRKMQGNMVYDLEEASGLLWDTTCIIACVMPRFTNWIFEPESCKAIRGTTHPMKQVTHHIVLQLREKRSFQILRKKKQSISKQGQGINTDRQI